MRKGSQSSASACLSGWKSVIRKFKTFFWCEERIGRELGEWCGSSSSGSVKHLIHKTMTAMVNHLISTPSVPNYTCIPTPPPVSISGALPHTWALSMYVLHSKLLRVHVGAGRGTGVPSASFGSSRSIDRWSNLKKSFLLSMSASFSSLPDGSLLSCAVNASLSRACFLLVTFHWPLHVPYLRVQEVRARIHVQLRESINPATAMTRNLCVDLC